jgi:hypothetical protein
MNLYKKNLLFRSHPRGLVYVAAVSLVLIGHIRTTCRPKPCPSPHPLFVFNPCQGQQENWGGKGRSRCRPSPASCAPTAFSHASDPSYMPAATVISDRPPFYRENAPVGAPRDGDDPASGTTELWGGGGLPRSGVEACWGGGGGGGWAGKCICCLKYLLSEKKFTGQLHLIPPTFLFE